MAPGHVFVTRGDITKLRCSAWLLPTDSGGFVVEAWRRAAQRAPFGNVPADGISPLRGRRAVALQPWFGPMGDAPAPVPILTDTGGTELTELAWYVESVRAFVDTALSVCTHPASWRERPLLAVPFLGGGAGGKGNDAGQHMRDLLAILRDAAVGADIVLVLFKDAPFAAAQTNRSDVDWMELPIELRALADDLAAKARSGDLVLFLGAGLSRSAGYPLWGELLAELAEAAHLSVTEIESLKLLPYLDAATVLEARFPQGELRSLIAEKFSATNYGLTHALTATLGLREAVTTNYDVLYERAFEDCGNTLSVLPHRPVNGADAWILKIHGCTTQPHDIVITRRDYLRYDATRSALFGIVQAMLITRHILFLGFSLNDENFYALIDEVRRAIDGHGTNVDRGPFGTAILQREKAFASELWERDLRIHAMLTATATQVAEANRSIEIFLDYLAYRAHDASAHILNPAYESGLSAADQELKIALSKVEVALESATDGVHQRLRRLLKAYGSNRT